APLVYLEAEFTKFRTLLRRALSRCLPSHCAWSRSPSERSWAKSLGVRRNSAAALSSGRSPVVSLLASTARSYTAVRPFRYPEGRGKCAKDHSVGGPQPSRGPSILVARVRGASQRPAECARRSCRAERSRESTGDVGGSLFCT